MTETGMTEPGVAGAGGAGAAGTGGAGTGTADAPAAAGRVVPLWRNYQFQVLWLGQSAATLGVSIADMAYPLTVLALTGSAARAGLFGAVQAAGALLAGLPGGQLADRLDWRRIVVAVEAGRAALTAAVIVALVLGVLSLPLLLAAAALLGIGQSVSSSARYLLVRSAVPPAQLTAALTQDEVRINGAALAGPPLGGGLYAIRALAHAVPFACVAASFLLSMVTALLIRVRPDGGVPDSGAVPAAATATTMPEEPDVPPVPAGAVPGQRTGLAGKAAPAGKASRAGGRLFAGVAALWRQPVLRAATVLLMILNTIGAGLDLVVIVILRHQGVAPAMIGVALGGGALGGLAGAPLIRVLHRVRPGILLLGICLLLAPAFALLAVPAGPYWAAGVLFVSMLGVPAIRVLMDVLVIRQAPAAERGRVIAAMLTLTGLGMPVGLAVSGLLLQYLPAPVAMLTLAGVLLAGVCYCARSAALRYARWPAA
ncbi:MAG TPA: MFS transporter [Streptosporangiaceae bacterium]|jgi:MFS family permease